MLGDCPFDMTAFQQRADFDDVLRASHPAARAKDGTIYVVDGELAIEVLKSDNFRNLDLHENFLKLEAKTGLDFSALHDVFDKLAPVRHGIGPRPARIELAQHMVSLEPELLAAAQRRIDHLADTVMRPGQSLDLGENLFFAIYSDNTRIITGLPDLDIWWAAELLRATFAQTSLRTRLALNDDLGEKAARMNGTRDEVALKLALAALGSEAFTATFIQSIWQIIQRQPDRPMNAIIWPEAPPATAAPFVERIADADWDNGTLSVRKGDKLRVVIGASVPYGPFETKNVMFGRGRHSCVGRRYSENLWTRLVAKFEQLDVIPELVSLQIREPDDFLNFPDSAVIRFHDS